MFETKRKDALFCSPNCNKKHQRQKNVPDNNLDPVVLDNIEKSRSDVRDNYENASVRITKVPEGKVGPEWYESEDYKNLIEELEVKPIYQLKREGYFIPNWKTLGLKRKPTPDELIGLAGGLDKNKMNN